MRNIFSLCALAGLTAVLATGCAGPEKKFGRGMSNIMEPVRMGEIRRSIEQKAIFERSSAPLATGFVHGLNKTLARTGMGIYEIITFPIPPYDPIGKNYVKPGRPYPDNYQPRLPIGKNYVKPGRPYPDNYQPRLLDDSLYATDTALGFSGGDVLPIVPGSRFHIFDN